MKAILLSFLTFYTILYGHHASAQVPVSFVYEHSLIFVKAKINGSRTNYLFLLNTGANNSVIDTRIAGLLKLPLSKELDSVTGTAGKESVAVCKVRSLQVGNALVKDMAVTRRSLDGFVNAGGQKIDGVLGTDFLSNFSINIDFRSKKLSFNGKPATIRKTIPFQMMDGIPRFDIKLDDTLLTCIHYNSGVSMEPARNVYINISYSQFADLKKINPYMKHTSYIDGRGIGGDLNLQVIKINLAQLGNTNITHPYVILQPQEGYFKRADAVGFFGNNLLEKYNNITIDFLSNKLHLNNIANIKQGKPRRKAIARSH